MRNAPLTFPLLCALVTSVAAQPAPNLPVMQPTGNYSDATIHMSWPILDYAHRCVQSNGKALLQKYPGAEKLGVFLSQHISDLSYLAISYRPGAEAARFKRKDDLGPNLEPVSQWVAVDMKPIAAFAEAAILRQIQIRDKRFDTGNIVEAWSFTKGVAGDVLVPREEAALVAKRFLAISQTPGALAGIDKPLKAEIEEFRGKFKFNIDLIVDPKKPFQKKDIDQWMIAKDQFDLDFRQKIRLQSGGA
jgi:hypothetical protein